MAEARIERHSAVVEQDLPDIDASITRHDPAAAERVLDAVEQTDCCIFMSCWQSAKGPKQSWSLIRSRDYTSILDAREFVALEIDIASATRKPIVQTPSLQKAFDLFKRITPAHSCLLS